MTIIGIESKSVFYYDTACDSAERYVSSSYLDGKNNCSTSLISSEVCASVCTHNKRVVGLIVDHVEFSCSLWVLQLPPTGQRHVCEADRKL